jgi:hypothetical protein
MSENLDLVRSIVAAHERGDYNSADWADPDIEYGIVGGLMSGSWKGQAAMAGAARELFATYTAHRTVAEEFLQLDSERVLVLAHIVGSGKTSGLELPEGQTKIAALYQVRDGKVITHVVYVNRASALADLGLEE